ncbi:hypothetical protein M409DRAFT_18983 [Zasmidium cellare ATCC 36951]|uniref:Ecp2 effector protein domain-containing protein n=1 Tax=Zasmidium cellare ATCC 36951 TaxID=1080233 RepID=A0A6A6CV74_ZASCE|nr:uncharacterized protein M409DRAFT_18983 [Zasmidium cellare ATCC 36951]KAF2171011.1 hypothetical protein M409DRAFT_18983 [Zasmidium cellare ATCC 36951]
MKTTTMLLAGALSLLSQVSATPASSGNSSCLRVRQDTNFDTEIEIGDNTVTATWVYTEDSGTNRDNHPGTEAFTELFDNIYDMCGPTQCGLDLSEPMEYCTTPLNSDLASPGAQQICLQAMGSFGSVSKDEIFNLGRAAFDGSVNRVYSDLPDVLIPQVEETGASFIHVVTGPGNAGGSGYDLSFNLFYMSQNEGCGPIIDRITEAGSVLGGQFAPAFGVIGLVCGYVS